MKSIKITILVEGGTERAFKPFLIKYLKRHLEGRMPKLDFLPYDGRIPTKDKLKRVVNNLLNGKGRQKSDYVIALTDVYTGKNDFVDAKDAKDKMKSWVGQRENRFYPHAAQHDFEAWLLPYWETIQKLAKHNISAPSQPPEQVNHNNPPAYRIKEIFRAGKRSSDYNKIIDSKKILEQNDLQTAIDQCPELKAFINTILTVCEVVPLP